MDHVPVVRELIECRDNVRSIAQEFMRGMADGSVEGDDRNDIAMAIVHLLDIEHSLNRNRSRLTVLFDDILNEKAGGSWALSLPRGLLSL